MKKRVQCIWWKCKSATFLIWEVLWLLVSMLNYFFLLSWVQFVKHYKLNWSIECLTRNKRQEQGTVLDEIIQNIKRCTKNVLILLPLFRLNCYLLLRSRQHPYEKGREGFCVMYSILLKYHAISSSPYFKWKLPCKK